MNIRPNNVLNRFFHAPCRLCLTNSGTTSGLCEACSAELPWQGIACLRCALPLPDKVSTHLCASCRDTPGGLDRCNALFTYQAPVRNWIHRLKFERDLAAAALLGSLMSQRLAAPEQQFELLPVPLHRRRLRQRGYNQALEIARPLLKQGWRLSKASIQRTRTTRPQSDLPADRRAANVRDAFSCRSSLEGRNILIIDDVMTTGATLNELADTLRRAGAAQVHAWVAARTP